MIDNQYRYAIFDVVTFGMKGADLGNKATTGYSTYQTTKEGYKE